MQGGRFEAGGRAGPHVVRCHPGRVRPPGAGQPDRAALEDSARRDEESQAFEINERHSGNAVFVERVADRNVRRSVRSVVNRSYILERLIEDGTVAIIGAKHDLATRRVQFFDDTWVWDRASMAALERDEMPRGRR